jgi:hypothetical protein
MVWFGKVRAGLAFVRMPYNLAPHHFQIPQFLIVDISFGRTFYEL